MSSNHKVDLLVMATISSHKHARRSSTPLLKGLRLRRAKTWKQVAKDAEVSASTLTRMAQGRRPDVDSLAALADWSELDLIDYRDS